MKAISEKSFNQIKTIEKDLKQEVDYDKKHNIADFDDFDFADLNDNKLIDKDIGYAIDENTDVLVATNLNIIMNFEDDGEIVIDYADMDYPFDDSLTVDDVYNIFKKLVKLGRQGIAERENKCSKLSKKIAKMQAKMDL